MKTKSVTAYYLRALFFLNLLLTFGCSNGQTNNKSLVSPQTFNQFIQELPNAYLLDVRTPEEFKNGHIPKAINIDYNSEQFLEKIKSLDASRPVLVYCMSGGRSSKSAAQLSKLGFKKIIELDGGMLKWRNAQMPEDKYINEPTKGISKTEFEALTVSNDLVLIDFYATWCGPCKKMKPILDEIELERKSAIKVERIDVDQNKELAKSMVIEEIPTFMIYKKGKLIWTGVGMFTKEDLNTQLGN